MIKLISLKCPECGSNLNVESDRKQCFCLYCGTKILIDDGSVTYTYHTIDEAKIKEVESKELIRLKELKFEIKKHNEEKREKCLKRISPLLWLGLAVILFVIAVKSDSLEVFAYCMLGAGVSFLIATMLFAAHI